MAIITPESEVINVSQFKMAVAPILKQYKNLIFDMGQMKMVDMSTCGALLTCLRQLNRSGGDLRLCNVRKSVMTLFDLLRIHHVIEIFGYPHKTGH